MASTIKIKNSSTAGAIPTSSDLVQGELAVNVTDKTIFTENASGTVVELGKNYTGFKNRIINGAMMIDQRNAGASVTYADNVFPVDRFVCAKSSTSVGTAQRSTTAPAGFTNSLLLTCSTGASPSAAQYNLLWHSIEGFNVGDLGWGTASAQSVTIGFWVRSSLTGTFAATLLNGSYARGYTFNYTVSAANTWEFKTATIQGDTSGTWATDNSTGIKLSFDLGSGSNSQGAAGTWGSVYYTTSGAQKVMATTGATFYITGVQLEKGSTATSFDYRPYGTELVLCQRYAVQVVNGESTQQSVALGQGQSASSANYYYQMSVPMRTGPSVSYSAVGDFLNDDGVGGAAPTGLTIARSTTLSCALVASGLTTAAGRAAQLRANNSSARLLLSAEL